MTYNELINNLSIDENILICTKNYLYQHFGNFIIELEYKKVLRIQILNDRGIIEISIEVPTLFSSMTVPLKYAVSYVQSDTNQQNQYTFGGVREAYLYFHSSYKLFDKIIQDNMLKLIANHWKNYNR